MAYAPCKNPNCNSFGKPHPNCKCYGEMAKGGDVEAFCSTERSHKKGCQYFQDGGDVAPDFVPDEEPQPDEAPTTEAAPEQPVAPEAPAAEAPDFIPDEAAKSEAPDFISDTEAKSEAPDFIPDGDAVADEGLHKITDEERQKGLQEFVSSDIEALVPGIAGGVATKAVAAASKLAKLGKVGASILEGAIANGLISGGDEVSRWALGTGDTNEAVGARLARTGISSLIGGVFGAGGALAEKAAAKGMQAFAGKFGERAEYFLYGLAHAAGEKGAATASDLEKMTEKAAKGYKEGQKFYQTITHRLLPPTLGAAAEGARGLWDDGLEGGLEGMKRGAVHGLEAQLLGKAIGAAGKKYIGPVMLKALSTGKIHELGNAVEHVGELAKGANALTKGVDGFFRMGGIGGEKLIDAYGDPKMRKKLDDYLTLGGQNQELKDEMRNQNSGDVQGFAHGGAVAPNPLKAQHVPSMYPEQNIMLHGAKTRVVSYLNSLRPTEHAPKLAFDDAPDTTEQKRSYEKALDIAATPLGILQETHNGTLEPEHVTHFKAMYPEVDGLLQKKLTERITQAQAKGEKPSYKMRQGLSLLMGTPLSGEFTPAIIQAAQSTFSQAGAQKHQDQTKPTSKNTSKLSKSDEAYLTGDQAREKREQRA